MTKTLLCRAVAISALIVVALPSIAYAGTGELDQSGSLGTGATNGARAIAVSPDGNDVYIASDGANAIQGFVRGLNGSLSDIGITGCVSDDGTGPCEDGVALEGARSVALSPNGKNAYVAAGFSDAIAIFKRKSNGDLDQLTSNPCVSDSIALAGVCKTTIGLDGAESVVVSPDGLNVYAASGGAKSVTAFERNTSNGALKQLSGTAGCITEDLVTGCKQGHALNAPFSIAISPDGENVYVVSGETGYVAAFSRDATTGKLKQLAGLDGCVSDSGAEDCVNGRGLDGAEAVTVSPDGNNVYVAADGNADSVAAFKRKSNGALKQLNLTDGCTNESASDGCADGHALIGARAVAVSPNGKWVYVAAGTSNAIVSLARDATTGALTELVGTAGCVSDDGTSATCENGGGLLQPEGVVVSTDNANVYSVSKGSSLIDYFQRI